MEVFLKVLKAVVACLFCFILILSIFAFMQKKSPKKLTINDSEFVPTQKNEKVLFSDIGTLRAKTKDGVTVVIAPFFEYSKGDLAFQEELVKKKLTFREIFLDFFLEQNVKEIKKSGEKKIKDELLVLINKRLVLNKIETLYFEKFILLE